MYLMFKSGFPKFFLQYLTFLCFISPSCNMILLGSVNHSGSLKNNCQSTNALYNYTLANIPKHGSTLVCYLTLSNKSHGTGIWVFDSMLPTFFMNQFHKKIFFDKRSLKRWEGFKKSLCVTLCNLIRVGVILKNRFVKQV